MQASKETTMNSKTTSGGGMGCGSVLGILFIALKLTGYIDWSWLWVLSPFWIPAAIIGIILVIVGLLVVTDK